VKVRWGGMGRWCGVCVYYVGVRVLCGLVEDKMSVESATLSAGLDENKVEGDRYKT